MNADKMIRIGAAGSIVAMICCFTPVLVILFGAIGLGGLIAGIDIILFPALAVFLGLLVFGIIGKRRTR